MFARSFVIRAPILALSIGMVPSAIFISVVGDGGPDGHGCAVLKESRYYPMTCSETQFCRVVGRKGNRRSGTTGGRVG